MHEINDWPRSATRKEWFSITRRIIQDSIADMNLDPAAESEVNEFNRFVSLITNRTFVRKSVNIGIWLETTTRDPNKGPNQ